MSPSGRRPAQKVGHEGEKHCCDSDLGARADRQGLEKIEITEVLHVCMCRKAVTAINC